MDADGSNPTNLTNDPSDDSAPEWSPYGTEIAFSSDRDGDDEIFVMDADGSNPTQITDNDTDDQSPAWSLALVESVPATSANGIVILVLLMVGLTSLALAVERPRSLQKHESRRG